MKLYFSPGACSLSPHIVLEELGLPYSAVKVDLKSKQTADGGDYTRINSKGSVPALQLDDGQLLTEGPAIVQYLGDQKPEANLTPRWGTPERYRLLEMLNFITSELHKGFSPLFNSAASADWKAGALATLKKKFDWLSGYLAGKSFLLGEQFTVADAYLFTVLGWAIPLKIDLSPWPVLKDYYARILHRPPVQAAMRAEGLVR
jgi:glutathione S-transferase